MELSKYFRCILWFFHTFLGSYSSIPFYSPFSLTFISTYTHTLTPHHSFYSNLSVYICLFHFFYSPISFTLSQFLHLNPSRKCALSKLKFYYKTKNRCSRVKMCLWFYVSFLRVDSSLRCVCIYASLCWINEWTNGWTWNEIHIKCNQQNFTYIEFICETNFIILYIFCIPFRWWVEWMDFILWQLFLLIRWWCVGWSI